MNGGLRAGNAPCARRCAGAALPLAGILLLALAARAAYGLLRPPDRDSTLNADRWGTIARNIVEGHGYTYPYHGDPVGPPRPDVERGPVPVLFYAGLFQLFGRTQLTVFLANWTLDLATVLLIYLLGIELFRRRGPALLGALAFAVYLPWVDSVSLYAYSEPIFTPLFLGFTLIFARALKEPRTARFALAGVLLGLAALARWTVSLVPLICLYFIWRHVPGRGAALRRFAVLAAAFAIIILPWVARNAVVFGRFIPGTALLGYNLILNHYYLEDPEDYFKKPDHDQVREITRQLVAAEGLDPETVPPDIADRLQTREALRRIARRPDRYAVLCASRFLRMWFQVGYRTAPSGKSLLVLLANAAAVALAVLAFLRYRGAWTPYAWPTVAIIAYHTLLFTLVNAIVRYSFPFLPYVFLFAAHALVAIAARRAPAPEAEPAEARAA